VIAIGAPFRGTALADTPFARFLQNPITAGAAGAKQFAEGLSSLPAVIHRDVAAGQLLGGMAYDASPLAKFVNSILTNRKLIPDLRPVSMAETLRVQNRDPALNVVRKNYLTIAPKNTEPTGTGRLFDFLHRITATDRDSDAAASRLAVLIQSRRLPVIASDPANILLDAQANDGLINTARQVWVGMGDEVAALVVADHLDVVGHFPAEYAPYQKPEGFLISGAHFRDAQFCALFGSIAMHIADAIEASLSRRSDFPRSVQAGMLCSAV
jgi:hypothetical protein